MMGLIKEILPKRPDLKIVVMSATLDATRFQVFFTKHVYFQKYFNDAPLYSVSGRTFDVEIFYSNEPQKDYLQAAQKLVLDVSFISMKLIFKTL